MLEPMHSLVANYGIVEMHVQVRAEGPMETIAQGKRSDTLGITCWSVAPCKGKSIITMCFRLLPDSDILLSKHRGTIVLKLVVGNILRQSQQCFQVVNAAVHTLRYNLQGHTIVVHCLCH